ncbi:MAG: hypothetical protein ACREUF_02735, partial [Solimonas sp.]
RETATSLVQSRRTAHNTVAPLRARVAGIVFAGLPTDLQKTLDEWQFGNIPAQVATATTLLDDYLKVVAQVDAVGLPQLDNVRLAWNSRRMDETRTVIGDQRNALDAITNSMRVLEEEEPGSPSLKQLAEAKQKWAEGDLPEATRLGVAAATTSFNEDAAIKMMALAKEKKATFQAGFLGRIGLIWEDPDGDLKRAQEAYDAGYPTRAMELAQSAYEAWDTADRSGLMRLSGLMGLMCLLSAGVWWLLRRLDEPDEQRRLDPYAAKGGHSLGDPEERRPNWQDWENTNQ